MAILMGMAVGGMTATILRAGIIILFGILLFNVQFAVSSVGLLLLVFFVAMAALYGMGMLLASIFLLLNREGWHLANLAQEPVYLVSGFYFPIKAFGFWVALGASIIPLTLGLDAMRQLAFSTDPSFGFLSVEIELLILIALSVVFIFAARYSLSYMERLAVREGRLTDSRN
jgi:ABC-2 type transport system permease protein